MAPAWAKGAFQTLTTPGNVLSPYMISYQDVAIWGCLNSVEYQGGYKDSLGGAFICHGALRDEREFTGSPPRRGSTNHEWAYKWGNRGPFPYFEIVWYDDVYSHGKGLGYCQRSTPYPIQIATGNKRQIDSDVSDPLGLERYYNSIDMAYTGPFGIGRSHQHDLKLMMVDPAIVARKRGDGFELVFTNTSGATWDGDDDVADTMVELKTAGLRTGWLYSARQSGQLEKFDVSGRLTDVVQLNGDARSHVYSDGTNGVGSQKGGYVLDDVGLATSQVLPSGLLLRVADQSGRYLSFAYDARSRVKTVRDATGRAWLYRYNDDGALTKVSYPDGSERSYLYGEVAYTSGKKRPGALTGVVDERGVRWITYFYDASGRAYEERLAGEVGKHAIDFSLSPVGEVKNVAMKDASDTSYVYGFKEILGVNRLVGTSQPAGAGCGASGSKIDYDSRGNVVLRDDFNGRRACHAHTTDLDGVRNLEKVLVEGLIGSTGGNAGVTPTDCATVTGAGATLPAGSRKISTQYHPDWALKIKQAEPNLLTTWVYNGQPDPFNGNQIASCSVAKYGAASVAPLPDGKPIAVLCKKVEQATQDANGSQGLSPTLVTDEGQVNRRGWQYTYNQYGQVLTSTDPLGKVTKYDYHCQDNATCDGTNKHVFTGTVPNEVGHYQGDLWKVTNPQGHVTEYLSYDRAGRVLSMKDPNGLLTSYSYTPRGWISSESRGGQTTSYEYWPTGLLKKVTQPDQSYLYYKYDDAHRLTDVTDKVDGSGTLIGNTVHYTLDNAGNRTAEDVKDSGGSLTRNIGRTYDALNRLHTITGSAQ
jgi:YD repeat-containing protein